MVAAEVRREKISTQRAQRSTEFTEEKRERPRFLPGPLFVSSIVSVCSYQFNLRANWNWRASKAAVGWPAAQVLAEGSQSG